MASVIETLRASTQEIAEAKARTEEINKASEQEYNTLSEATAKGTLSGPGGVPTTVKVEAQKRAGDLEAQAANQRMAETVDYANRSNELLQVINQAGSREVAKRAEIEAIRTSSNPLTQIVGAFTIPFKADSARSSANLRRAASETLSDINQSMQSSARTSAEIATRVTEATNADLNEALAHDQIAAASKAKIMALASNAHNIKGILDMSAHQVNNKVKEFEIGEAVSVRALRKAQTEQIMEMRDAAQKDKEAGKLAIDSINHALLKNNKTAIPVDQEVSVLKELSAKTGLGDMLRNLYEQGLKAKISGGKFAQADTPAEAAEARVNMAYTPANIVEQEMLGVVDDLLINSPGVKGAKNLAERKEAGNLAVSDRLARDQENITTDKNSLAKPMSWETMAKSAAFATDPIFKNIIAPQITDNISKDAIDPQDLFKRLDAAVTNKQATIDQVVQFHKLYAGQSLLLNNDLALRKLTGLEQTKFIAKVALPRYRTALFHPSSLGISETPGTRVGEVAVTTLNLFPSVIDMVSGLLPHTLESVDMLNDARLYDAYTASQANKLREPPK